ncbi:MAG: hypothetical protein ABSG53_09650 [Thermoguttaceae bacterium]|jgi:hypothetical protein
MINQESEQMQAIIGLCVGSLVALAILLFYRGPWKYSEPETLVVLPIRGWLRWRWIPVALLYLFGGLCLFAAFVGAFWFDGEGACMLSHDRVASWRCEFWDLFCTWPANGLKGCVAIYAGWAIWWRNWKATRRAVVALAILLALAAVANYLAWHVLHVF